MFAKRTTSKAIETALGRTATPPLRSPSLSVKRDTPLGHRVEIDSSGADELLNTYKQDLKVLMASSRRTRTRNSVSPMILRGSGRK